MLREEETIILRKNTPIGKKVSNGLNVYIKYHYSAGSGCINVF